MTIRVETAIAPMTMPAIAPTDKAGFGEGIDAWLVGDAVADDIGGEVGKVESEAAVAVTEDEVIIPT